MRWLLFAVLLFQAAILIKCGDDVNLDDIYKFIKKVTEKCKHDVEYKVKRSEEVGKHPGSHPYNPFHRVARIMDALGPAIPMSYVAQTNREILYEIVKRYGLDKKQILKILPKLPAIARFPKHSKVTAKKDYWYKGVDSCPYPKNDDLECDPHARYRNIDGSCNNLKNPLWGSSFRPLGRLLKADYGNGFDSPRTDTEGNPLPNERLISIAIFQEPAEDQDPAITLASMVFGQIMDHDIGRTAVTQHPGPNGTTAEVECGEDGCSTEGSENEACLPIDIPEGDNVFGGVKDCLKFVRSEGVTSDDCTLDQRQQLNQITSHLDLSMVYGSTDEELALLRDSDASRGRMATQDNPKEGIKPLLPTQPDDAECQATAPDQQCFRAGDTRSNEMIGLTAWHTALVRYHNVIEQQLFDLGLGWSGEELFQETRHILIAVWQNVIFNEFLPTTLGPEAMTKYALWLQEHGAWDPYNPHTDPSTNNAFQTGAFRFGHSQIPNDIRLFDKTYTFSKTKSLGEVFFNPEEFYTNANPAGATVDGVFFGQVSERAEKMDCAFAKIITNHLFAEPFDAPGTDLPSLNVRRGRDHGIPSYFRWRKFCGLSEDLSDIPERKHDTLKQLYNSLEDIDIFVGGSMEKPVSGGITGPLFTCLISIQFHNYKSGDRFWFERPGKTGFTEEQRQSIRSMTMSRVLCDTLDDVGEIQPFIQLQPIDILWNTLFNTGRWSEVYQYRHHYRRDLNRRRPCSKLPALDISLWAKKW